MDAAGVLLVDLEDLSDAVLDHLAVRPGWLQEPATQPRAQSHWGTDVRSGALAHLACLLDSSAGEPYVVPSTRVGLVTPIRRRSQTRRARNNQYQGQ